MQVNINHQNYVGVGHVTCGGMLDQNSISTKFPKKNCSTKTVCTYQKKSRQPG